MQKLGNGDPAEMEKSKEKQKELELMKEAVWNEMNKIMKVLVACYGKPKKCNNEHKEEEN